MAPKNSSLLPAVLSPALSFWLINYLKEGNCRSYFENGKDKAVKKHLTSNGFFSQHVLYFAFRGDAS